MFGRLGWNDGTNETWAYTESDRNASLGAQVSGVHWGREEDPFGLAINGLSSQRRDYLAGGSTGILQGDGKLNYGTEQVFETYYRFQIGRYAQLSPDFQYVQNPGVQP